jgi:hypothetical protein
LTDTTTNGGTLSGGSLAGSITSAATITGGEIASATLSECTLSINGTEYTMSVESGTGYLLLTAVMGV